MKKKNKLIILTVVCLTFLSTISLKAQLTATAQIRTRGEFRDGQGTLLAKGAAPASFISQRTRINIGYTGYRFKIFTAIQDVRDWGQDASTINRSTTANNNGLMLHEAWAEIMLNDTAPKSHIENLSLKIGRQEIAYDDQRILGNLDWLQQARRHDAVILKFANKGWIADLGAAYNQNSELTADAAYVGTVPAGSNYTAGTNAIGTMYKSMQYLYVGKKFYFGDASFLFFKDDFSKYTKAGANVNYGTGVWSRITTGGYINATILRKLLIVGSYYHQAGQDKDGLYLDANLASLTSSLQIGRKLFVGPGVDYMSGDNGTVANSVNHRFDPLYGTPHKFYGFMDYFYAANGSPKQGLLNYMFKIKYNIKDNLILMIDLHGFETPAAMSNGKGGRLNPYLGTEVDFLVRYNLTKIINVEAGYSIMSATTSMASAAVKNVANPQLTPQWFYVMLNIKPNFLAK